MGIVFQHHTWSKISSNKSKHSQHVLLLLFNVNLSIQLRGAYSEIALCWRPVAIAGPFQTNPHTYCAPLKQHGNKCCRSDSMRNTHTLLMPDGVCRWYLLFNWRLWIWFFRPCSISLSMVTSELSNDEQMDSASFQVLPSLGLLGKWSRRHCTHTIYY